ncbi:MAG TPA: DUF6058 family natural product biosynthesis protein [Kofleriaceae bacterium]|nr:DUF6058 family natural product biosynthesis protein [Kofleriaceae bacterium]
MGRTIIETAPPADAPAHPALAAEDVRYVVRDFLSLVAVCAGRAETESDVRRFMAEGLLPRATYVLPDGTEMMPADYFALADRAGGARALPAWFRRRLGQELAALGMEPSPGRLDEEWSGYASGEYGVCLRAVSPENIAAKAHLMGAIEGLLEEPRPGEGEWRESLRRSVDQLDRMLREFATCDRLRFGGPVSRDRLVTAVRERYAGIWDAASDAVGCPERGSSTGSSDG